MANYYGMVYENYATGWRKGVIDSDLGAEMWNALDRAFNSDDLVIEDMLEKYIVHIAKVTAEAMESGISDERLMEVIKEAALAELELPASKSLDADMKLATLARFRAMLPLEWEQWGRTYRMAGDGEAGRLRMEVKRDKGWELNSYMHMDDDTVQVALAIINRLSSGISKDQASATARAMRKAYKDRIETAAKRCDDSDWKAITNWLLYYKKCFDACV